MSAVTVAGGWWPDALPGGDWLYERTPLVLTYSPTYNVIDVSVPMEGWPDGKPMISLPVAGLLALLAEATVAEHGSYTHPLGPDRRETARRIAEEIARTQSGAPAA